MSIPTRPRLPLLVIACFALAVTMPAADEHAGHDHAPGHHHDPIRPIGVAEVGTGKVGVAAGGLAVAGKGWHVAVLVDPAGTAPKAVRLWVGLANARGSVKAKAEAVKDAKGIYETHVEVPNPLPEGARLWIALEPNEGEPVKGSLALPSAAAATPHVHQPGDGHQH